VAPTLRPIELRAMSERKEREMRKALVFVASGLLAVGLTVAPAAAAGKAAPTGCTAVTPEDLASIFGMQFQAGAQAGPMYLPGTCTFTTVVRIPEPGETTGAVTVYVSTGTKAKKDYGAREKAFTKDQRAVLRGVGKKAFVATRTDLTMPRHELAALGKGRYVNIDAFLTASVAGAPSVDGVSQPDLANLAKAVLAQR
jgi:hypothetical protein